MLHVNYSNKACPIVRLNLCAPAELTLIWISSYTNSSNRNNFIVLLIATIPRMLLSIESIHRDKHA